MSDYREERTYNVQLRLSATFPDDYEGDDDGYEWHAHFDRVVRPRIARAVIEGVGGTLEIESDIDQQGGTEVLVTLPIDVSPPLGPRAETAPGRSDESTAAAVVSKPA